MPGDQCGNDIRGFWDVMVREVMVSDVVIKWS